MTADEYVSSIIRKYNVTGEIDSFTKSTVVDPLVMIIKEWAATQLIDIY